jgi:prepilin-type N-terminal cleavage/methylation domain-containing protein
MSRASRHSGFTLVELMTVVCIVAIVGALAARMYSRGVRGEAAPGFARTMMATMLDARHSAMVLGRTTRVTLSPASPAMTVLTETYDPNSTNWVKQSTLSMPSSMRFCTPPSGGGIQIGTQTPTCPMTAATVLCFYANGRVDVPSNGTCQISSPTTGSGATIYFGTNDSGKKYRMWVWGLTGMVKMVDQW